MVFDFNIWVKLCTKARLIFLSNKSKCSGCFIIDFDLLN